MFCAFLLEKFSTTSVDRTEKGAICLIIHFSLGSLHSARMIPLLSRKGKNPISFLLLCIILVFLKLIISLDKHSCFTSNQVLHSETSTNLPETLSNLGSKYKFRIRISLRQLSDENSFPNELGLKLMLHKTPSFNIGGQFKLIVHLLVFIGQFLMIVRNTVFTFQPKETPQPIIFHRFSIANATCSLINWVSNAIDVIQMIHCCRIHYYSYSIGHKE